MLAGAAGCNIVLGLGDYTDTGSTGTSSSGSGGGTGGSGPKPVCEPGTKKTCPYSGPSGTEGKGICRVGEQTCKADGTGYEECEGEVLPKPQEDCTTPDDDDCNGMANEATAGCVCTPNTATHCYSGPDGTENQGLCVGGMMTCNMDGKGYGACAGEVVPKTEDCATPGDDDCDGTPNQVSAGCNCTPGTMMSCYSGPAGTENNAPCQVGTQTCNGTGTGYDTCMGEVTPISETCATPEDDDCNGYDCVEWAFGFGDDTDQLPHGVARDSTGAIYVVGQFQGTIALPGLNLTDAGSRDVFLIKLGPTGNVIWGKQFGDGSWQDGTAVTVDTSDNVYIGGFSTTAVTFGGANVAAGLFVAKFNAAGQHQWSKSLGGNAVACGASGYSQLAGLAATPLGDIAVTGSYCGNISFGDAAITAQGNGASHDMFVAKLRGSDGSGKVSDGFWGKVFGDNANQFARGVAVDGAGSIFTAGDLNGSMVLGSTLTSAGLADVYLAKFSTTGTVLFSTSAGDAVMQRVSAIGVDSLGGVIVTGYFAGTMTFPGNVITAPAGGAGYAFRYNAALNFQWLKQFGDSFGNHTVGRDNNGNIFLAAPYKQTLDLGAGPLTAIGNGYNIFLAKVAANGNVLWNKTFGAVGDQYPVALTSSPMDEAIMVGMTGGAATDFGNGPLMPQGGFDGFVAKFAP